ncbi:DNA invertase Pin-like site-specific DNA recombinase [Bradyrhizobium elkanii]
MPHPQVVAYYRVSTARQGRSGLGLEAQRQAVQTYLGEQRPISEFVEVESGTSGDRPQLAAALTACRVHKAILVLAKLDRLARNVAFVAALMDSGVEFLACDFPQANRLTIHILAAVAEHEAKMISERTKAALAAARARGAVLGGFRGRAGTCTDLEKARAVRTAKADSRAMDLATTMQRLQSEGARSFRAIAAGLNSRGITACRGGAWTAAQVRSTLRRTGLHTGTLPLTSDQREFMASPGSETMPVLASRSAEPVGPISLTASLR